MKDRIDSNVNYIKYFIKLINDFDESTVLNPDLNGTKTPKLNKEETSISIEKEFCEKNLVTDNTLFLGATALALNKFNFSHKNLIFHENNIIFTTNFENREISIQDYLMKIGEDYEENLKYAHFSIDSVIDEYNLKSGVYYAFNRELDINSSEYKYDLYVNISGENDDKYTLSVLYNNQLYSAEYMGIFLESISQIISQLMSSDISKSALSDIYLVNEDEDFEIKDIKTPFLHKRFEEQVEKNPDNIALISNDEHITYDELNRKANRVANGLIKRGIKPKSNILIMFHRNSNLIAALLGVLKAGCAYIPIDMSLPKERINYMYQNSHADYILSEDSSLENTIDINELLEEENTENPSVEISPDDLAYILYTSGSTGNPKGVMGSHANITNVFTEDENNIIYKAYKELKKNLGVVTVAFVAFITDFITLTYGNTLVFANDDEVKNIESLARLMKKEKPTALTFTTPSRLKQYLEYEPFVDELSHIRHIALGGEKVTNDVLPELLVNERMDVYIVYGCTEVSGTATLEKVNSVDQELTIGDSPYNVIA